MDERSASRADRTSLIVEAARLAVVAVATAGAYELATSTRLGQWLVGDLFAGDERAVLLIVVLGAALGYVGGGAIGRFAYGRLDAAEHRLHQVSSGQLLTSLIGGLLGLAVGMALTWPALLLLPWYLALPLIGFVLVCTTTLGMRVGSARGGDLLRALGARGRLEVTSPSSGPRARLVDTSALIDGRIVDVCRGGFLEGNLVLPRFVVYELQGLADAADEERRRRGKRGLDVLGALQRASSVSLEVADQDYPDITAVDAKLVAMAKERGAPLVTVDGNLARVAEVQGVRVLNLHQLAEDLRPPVLPGDELALRITRPGKEPGQGVGYLADGTMVVVEGAREQIGDDVRAEVTSILSTAHGRMVFATRCEAATALRASRAAAAE